MHLPIFAVVIVSAVSIQFKNGKLILLYLFALIIVFVDTDECGEEGTSCVPLVDCKWAKELLRQNKTPQNCGFDGKTPRVCCPTVAGIRLPLSGDLINRGKSNVTLNFFRKINKTNVSLCKF